MPERLLTVSELVDICSPPDEESRSIWTRRLRDWSNAGILPTARRHHEGTGRHRLYHRDTAYLAAVMLCMADQGVSVRALENLAGMLHRPGRNISSVREFKQFWRDARTSAASFPFPLHRGVHLAISLDREGTLSWYIDYGPLSVEGGAWTIVNLTFIFRQLKT
jgi:DNA-binding transcriptional MerR regulator